MEDTKTRLRKTFHYPADNDSDDSLPEALDEQEQETLIRTLDEQNTKLNIIYSRALLALPLLSLIPYLTTLFTPQTTLLSLLSITSLFSTSYLLFFLPPGETGIKLLDVSNQHSTPLSRKERLWREVDDGPIRLYLPYLNLGLCSVLALLGAVVSRNVEMWWGFGWLPAGVYGVVLVAKWVMGSVDPESELGGLRYEFKGA